MDLHKYWKQCWEFDWLSEILGRISDQAEEKSKKEQT